MYGVVGGEAGLRQQRVLRSGSVHFCSLQFSLIMVLLEAFLRAPVEVRLRWAAVPLALRSRLGAVDGVSSLSGPQDRLRSSAPPTRTLL